LKAICAGSVLVRDSCQSRRVGFKVGVGAGLIEHFTRIHIYCDNTHPIDRTLWPSG
jgi:hypothetical protein